jgi:hypothetical protein
MCIQGGREKCVLSQIQTGYKEEGETSRRCRTSSGETSLLCARPSVLSVPPRCARCEILTMELLLALMASMFMLFSRPAARGVRLHGAEQRERGVRAQGGTRRVRLVRKDGRDVSS